jgi:phospholipid/cholesterol/gamma-HCH transport system substrate-binding protein
MSIDRNEVRAGLLVLVSLVVLGGGLFVLAGSRTFLHETRVLVAEFVNVRGVRPGDPVRFAGLRVGEVDSLHVRSDLAPPRIEAHLRLRADVAVPIDSRISVNETLTGSRIVEILPGSGEPMGPDDRLIDEREPRGLADLAESAHGLASGLEGAVEEATGVIQRLDRVVAGIETALAEGDVRKSLRSVSEGTAAASAAIQELKVIVAELHPVIVEAANEIRDTGRTASDLLEEMRPEIKAILARVLVAVDEVAKLVEGTESPVGKILARLDVAAGDLRGVLAEVTGTSREARGILADSRPKLEGILDRLRTTGVNLQAASEDLRAHPWKLVNKPSDPEQRVQLIFNAARNFNSAAEALSDVSRDLRAAMARREVDEERVSELLERLGRSFEEYRRVEGLFWKALEPGKR